VKRDFERTKQIGHSASLQTVSRLATTAVGASGAIYGPGTAIPHRADFNTLDNPFAWSADPSATDGGRRRRGVHFVVFNPSSDDFNRGRLAMDGCSRTDEAAVRPARPRPGLQLDPAHDPPAELPRPAAAAPVVPAGRALS
jgi:hypothetical protein